MIYKKLDLALDTDTKDFANFLSNSNFLLDLVVMLPGILLGKNLSSYSADEIESVMNINFNKQALLLKYINPYFAEKSQVIMMSSISAERGSFDPIYAASKGAMISFIKSLSTWLAPKTRFNAIAPGLIENSTMFLDMAEERREFHKNATPTKSLVNSVEIAKVIYDLSKPHWSSLNGVVLRLNGGSYV